MPMRVLFAGQDETHRGATVSRASRQDEHLGIWGVTLRLGEARRVRDRESYGDHTDTDDTRGRNLTLTLSFLFVHGSALPFRFGSLGQPADSPAYSESAINTASKKTLIIPFRVVIDAEAFLLSPCFCSLSQVIIDGLLQVLGGVTWQLSKVCFGFKPRKTERRDLPSCDCPLLLLHSCYHGGRHHPLSVLWSNPTISVQFSMSRGPARGQINPHCSCLSFL
jgi:hypothetical protein